MRLASSTASGHEKKEKKPPARPALSVITLDVANPAL
jgi:hypothetical protein